MRTTTTVREIVKAVIEELAVLIAIALFVGMIALWAIILNSRIS